MTRGVSRRALALAVALLLAGFALRVHAITALPLYQDETYHLRRAQAVTRFADNPIAYAHGKLLLYYWIGLFDPAYTEAGLATARMAVALSGLVAAAGAAALARSLFGGRAAILALAFAALAPYALFYDRLALSDSFAGALATLAGWWSLTAIHRPTRRRGIVLGVLLGAAILAKLSTLPIVALPALAALLDARTRPAGRDRAAWIAWLRGRRQAARAVVRPVAIVLAAVGALYALGALAAALADRPGEPYDPELFDLARGLPGLLDNLAQAAAAFGVFLSGPMCVLLAALAGAVAWGRPRAGAYLLAWLALLYVPFLAFAVAFQTRYFVPGLPPLAALFGGGIAVLGERLPHPRIGWALGGGALALWAVGFALPYAHTLATDPAAAPTIAIDTRNFYRYTSNAWGTRAALADLAAEGERLDGRVPLVGAMHYCTLPALYVTPALDWTCMDARVSFAPLTHMPEDVTAWFALIDAVQRRPFTYLVTDYLPPNANPGDEALAWEPVAQYQRPKGDRFVTVWRVTLRDPAALADRLGARP